MPARSPLMRPDQGVPRWLSRMAAWAFGLAVIGVAALAAGLAGGLADPRTAGPLWLHDDFENGAAGWTLRPAEGAALTADGPGLWAEFSPQAAGRQAAALLQAAPPGDFTLEIGAHQPAAEEAAAYGLLFDWQSEGCYSAVLVNGHGYAEAFRQCGAERDEWFEWKQWPHVLADANRVRVDVHGPRVRVLINDEVLVEIPEGLADSPGQIGVVARAPDLGAQTAGPSQVVFDWVKIWARP